MFSSLRQIQELIRKGQQTHTSIVAAYLERIHECNPRLNSFVEVYEQEALQRAKLLDQQYEKDCHGRLTGLVLAVKDNICHEGHICSAASRMLESFEAQYTATALQRLLDEGAIVIGRTNCDEFAMGSTNETSYYGPVRNPFDSTRVAGGSSGGSAAAVASQMCLAALGSDTGGSVRQPAAFCGVYGLKPSYGAVSRHGLIAYASSLDQIGVLTQSLEDARLLLEIMAGPDQFDATLCEKGLNFRERESNGKRYRFAFIREAFDPEILDKELQVELKASIGQFGEAGHLVEEVDFPLFDCLVPTYSVLAMAEAASNLSRYSGMHFGSRFDSRARDLVSESRTIAFGEEVKKRIMTGNLVLTSDHYQAYFRKAQQVRHKICLELDALFEHYDGLLLPVTSQTAYSLNYFKGDSVTMLSDDRFTVLANLAGLPSLAVPIGHDSAGMSLSMQLVAKRFEDESLLEMAAVLPRN